MSLTHRCIDCPSAEEHEEDEICPSCGRCEKHCVADTHKPMRRIGD